MHSRAPHQPTACRSFAPTPSSCVCDESGCSYACAMSRAHPAYPETTSHLPSAFGEHSGDASRVAPSRGGWGGCGECATHRHGAVVGAAETVTRCRGLAEPAPAPRVSTNEGGGSTMQSLSARSSVSAPVLLSHYTLPTARRTFPYAARVGETPGQQIASAGASKGGARRARLDGRPGRPCACLRYGGQAPSTVVTSRPPHMPR